MDADPQNDLLLTVVVPAYNEEETLRPLYASLKPLLDRLGRAYELLFMDDGSTDGSSDVLRALPAQDDRVELVTLRRNLGKAMTLAAGFRRARGEVIVTLEGGSDLVCGWRRRRQHPRLKVILSRIYNWATQAVTGVPLHDFNCGFKAYRRDLLTHLRLYGELHRYIPVLAAWRGYRITELMVRHHPRRAGRSKYGTARIPHGFLDLLNIAFLRRDNTRPLHLLGEAGNLMIVLGLEINLYLTGLRMLGHHLIGTRPFSG